MNDPSIARLSRRDCALLMALREHADLGLAPPEIPLRIARKLASAGLVEGDSLPLRVQIGSVLQCSIEPGTLLVSTIVLSPRLVREPGDIVVTSPLGMALLGLPEGSSITIEDPAVTVRVDKISPLQAHDDPEMVTNLSAFMESMQDFR